MKIMSKFRFILLIVMTMVGLEVFGQSDPSMTFTPDGGLEFDASGGEKDVLVTTNVSNWKISSVSETWVKATRSGDQIHVKVKPNSTESRRTATISVSSDDLEEDKTIRVYQNAPYCDIFGIRPIPAKPTENLTCEVSSNASWKVEVTSGDWLELVSPEDGMGSGDGQIVLKPTGENTSTTKRVATLTITNRDCPQQSESYTITQLGAVNYLSVVPTSLLYNPDGSTQKVTVWSNVDWTVATEGGSGWLTVTPSNGSKDGELAVTAIKNNGSAKREATITITASGLADQVIKVTQEGSGYLSVNNTSLLYNPSGSTQKITVTSNVGWTVSTVGGGGWLTINPKNGNGNKEITVTASENTGSAKREAIITISSSGLDPQIIKVTQAGSGYLNAGTTKMLFNPDASTLKLQILSNIDWNVSVEGGNGWLKVDKPNGTHDDEILVTTTANTGSSPREAVIKITGEGLSQTVNVYQSGTGYLTVDQTTLRFNPDPKTQQFTITSNVEWNITVEKGGGWLNVSPLHGANNSNIDVSVEDNSGNSSPREAIITIIGDGLTQSVKVTQSGTGYLNAGTTLLSFNPEGETKTFNVESNVSWNISIEGGNDWLDISPKDKTVSGNDVTEVSVTAKDNTGSPSSRSAIITIIGENGLSQSIKVSQSGYGYLTVGKTALNFNQGEGSETFTVESNVSWSISTEGGNDWLTISDTEKEVSGNDIQEVRVSVTDNTKSSSSRSATITIIGEHGLTQKINVTQDGTAKMKVDPPTLDFNNQGGNKQIGIESNVEWKVDCQIIVGEDGWIHVTTSEPNKDDGTIYVTVENNSGNSSREAHISVTWNDGSSYHTETIKVFQRGYASLTPVPGNLSFTTTGGEQELTINHNVDWNIDIEYQEGEGWLEVSPTSAMADKDTTTIVKIKAEEYQGRESRRANINIHWNDGARNITTQVAVSQSQQTGIIEISGDNVDTKNGKRVDLEKEASSVTLRIKSNGEWNVSLPNWITASIEEGTRDTEEFVLNVKDNPNTTQRSDYVKVKLKDNSAADSVLIIQSGTANLKIEKADSVPFTIKGGSKYCVIVSNVDWKYSIPSNGSWLSLRRVEKTNDSTKVKITADPNNVPGSKERSAYIYITYLGPDNEYKTDSIYFVQNHCPVVPELAIDKVGISNTTSLAIDNDTVRYTMGAKDAKLSIDTKDFENASKWLFKWDVDGNTISTRNKLENIDTLFTKKQEYSVKLEISYEDDPDNPKLSKSLEFKLRPCPKCPDELVMKGKGASGIMIAKFNNMADSADNYKDYKYVFGFDDNNKVGTTSNLYYQYPDKSVVQNTDRKKWVYTQWDISTDTGNKTVESINRRYVYKEGETGKEEVNTRSSSSDPTSITSVECGEIKIVDGRLIANVASPVDAVIDIISVSGNTVRRMQLPSSTTFNEKIDFKGLSAGVYIVKCTIGHKHVEQKMVIK